VTKHDLLASELAPHSPDLALCAFSGTRFLLSVARGDIDRLGTVPSRCTADAGVAVGQALQEGG
jgi:hypothetical protein